MSPLARFATTILMLSALALFFEGAVRAADSADDLYAKGRFKEAEAAYQKLDMDHPKDLRYRYDRGCAAYQGGNLEEARAAFTSVAMRATNEDMKYRALYNLGNTAYKKGDYGAARDSYAQALAVNPGDRDARHNLELSLKALKKEQEARKEQQSKDGRKGGKDGQGKDQQGKDAQQSGKDQGKSGQQDGKDKDQKGGADKNGPQRGQDKGQQGGGKPQGRQPGQSPAGQGLEQGKQDLSGELKGKNMGTGNGANGSTRDVSQAAAMERKRAEALLDNTKENRARARELKGVQGGIPVGSGKEW
jgi:Ca-activated chloride channel homolog